MSRLASSVLAVLLALALPVAAQAAEWTFMVYMCADNDLENFGVDDFLEMASVGSDANINIIVQMDRSNGYDARYEDWKSCKRYKITAGATPTSAAAVQDLGETNMGDPAVLTDFINWAATNYPANKYALILWDHGDGWRGEKQATAKAVCNDGSSGDVLYTREVRQALANATTKVNLIGFDACLMSMVEVAYELRAAGPTVMVASEEVEPGEGYPYNTIMSALKSTPTMTPATLATTIVEKYYASYGNDQTSAALDLTRISTLSDLISVFADKMRTGWKTDQAGIKTAAQAVLDEIKVNKSVITSRAGTGWPGANGVAIYFPTQSQTYDTDYDSTIQFSANGSWNEFLTYYRTSMSGSWIATARTASQKFDSPEHIDLADFCTRVVNAAGSVSNDAFAQRTTITGSTANVTGSNVGATKETSEPNHAGNSGGHSVWWTWTAPAGGNVTITTTGSNFDTLLGAYTGTSVSGLTTKASNDDDASAGGACSKVSFAVTSGTTYQIAVDGYSGATGSIVLNLSLSTSGPTPTPTATAVATPTRTPVGPTPTPTVTPTATPGSGTSGTLAKYTFESSNGTASSVVTGITAGTFTSRDGTVTYPTGCSPTAVHACSDSGWTTSGHYFEFSVTVTGTSMTLTGLQLNNLASSTGPSTFEVRYSTNNFTSYASAGSRTVSKSSFGSQSFTLSGLTNLARNTQLKIRFYATGATGSAGSWRVDNVTLTGNVVRSGNEDGSVAVLPEEVPVDNETDEAEEPTVLELTDNATVYNNAIEPEATQDDQQDQSANESAKPEFTPTPQVITLETDKGPGLPMFMCGSGTPLTVLGVALGLVAVRRRRTA